MENYVNIATLENVIEAQLLESILKEREIPHVIESFQDADWDGIRQTAWGWGCIQAPEDWQKVILYILSDLRKDAGRA